MSNVFSRSWEITKLSFAVVKKDKEMLWYPIFSAILSGVFMLGMLFPTVIAELMEGNGFDQFSWVEYLLMFLTYYGLSFIATFFNVCVVYTAQQRFKGKNATIGSSIKFAGARIHRIAAWAFLAAVVGVILRMIENAARNSKGAGKVGLNIVRGVAGFAWGILTIFVVPAMVYDNLGPFDAIKKSGQTFKKTWGETIIRNFSMGLIQFLVILLGAVGFGALIYLGVIGANTPLMIGAIIGLIVFVVIVGLVFSSAEKVYNTALYEYANSHKIPSGFNKEVMAQGFRTK